MRETFIVTVHRKIEQTAQVEVKAESVEGARIQALSDAEHCQEAWKEIGNELETGSIRVTTPARRKR